jgi:hypothetical protein
LFDSRKKKERNSKKQRPHSEGMVALILLTAPTLPTLSKVSEDNHFVTGEMKPVVAETNFAKQILTHDFRIHPPST